MNIFSLDRCQRTRLFQLARAAMSYSRGWKGRQAAGREGGSKTKSRKDSARLLYGRVCERGVTLMRRSGRRVNFKEGSEEEHLQHLSHDSKTDTRTDKRLVSSPHVRLVFGPMSYRAYLCLCFSNTHTQTDARTHTRADPTLQRKI